LTQTHPELVKKRKTPTAAVVRLLSAPPALEREGQAVKAGI
jgi:hypothetical protein